MNGRTKIKIYLDNCCLNRTFDDQSQPRIYFESAAIQIQPLDEAIKKRAVELAQPGSLGAVDALHLAFAERLQVQYFLTCDDAIQSRYQGLVQVANPVVFVTEIMEMRRL